MNTIRSGRREPFTSAASRLCLWLAILACTGCGQLLTGTFRVSEGIGRPQDEGTLILAEVNVALTREQALARFRPADFRAAGLSETEVTEGTAVFVSPYRQRQTPLVPAQGLFALVKLDAASLDVRRSCGGRGCSYGGDAVAVRVLKRPSEGVGAPGVLYVVEAVVEPASVQGDCYYVPRRGREALHCKSLDSKGWEWNEDVFVKRPGPATTR
jgi:hypothetical protein